MSDNNYPQFGPQHRAGIIRRAFAARRTGMAFIALVFATAGTYLTLGSSATTFDTVSEAETGQIAGNAALASVGDASGGAAVVLGSTAPPTGLVGSVTSLTLINADTDQPIAGYEAIASDASLNLADLPTRNLNIRANTSTAGGPVGSVRFNYDTQPTFKTDSGVPYALGSETNGNYGAWVPTRGYHEVIVTPYSAASAGGTVGTGYKIGFTVTDPSAAPLGRVAISSDGNMHDNDDWGATAMTLALLAKNGQQANLIHYDYSDHIWGSDSGDPAQMTESALGGASRFGFNSAVFFDDLIPSQYSAGTAHLAAAINASSANDQLNLVLAGPMETAWQAMNAADPAKRQYVKCISHSVWNDIHASEPGHAGHTHNGHSYNDLIALGCQNAHINLQDRLNQQPVANWAWLNNGDTKYQWLYGRTNLARGDVSDSGMVYWLLTGDGLGYAKKYQMFFGL